MNLMRLIRVIMALVEINKFKIKLIKNSFTQKQKGKIIGVKLIYNYQKIL